MYHSITFGTMNTWDDWHLIPRTRPVFNPPPIKSNFVDVPGADGILDLSTALSGRPLYGNRSGSLEFIADNDFRDWATLFSDIMNYLHGQKMRAVLEDDAAYYYEGRFSVNTWKSDPYYSLITIDYNVGPFKMEIASTLDEWLWDPFNFESGSIQSYNNLVINGTHALTLEGRHIPIVPILIVTAGALSVSFGGTTHALTTGENRIPEIVLARGANLLTFTGTGTISIDYSGGSL